MDALHNAIENYITSQRAFLLVLGTCFENKNNKKDFPNTDLEKLFRESWISAYDITDNLAKLLEVSPKTGKEISETAENNVIVDQQASIDLEKLYGSE